MAPRSFWRYLVRRGTIDRILREPVISVSRHPSSQPSQIPPPRFSKGARIRGTAAAVREPPLYVKLRGIPPSTSQVQGQGSGYRRGTVQSGLLAVAALYGFLRELAAGRAALCPVASAARRPARHLVGDGGHRPFRIIVPALVRGVLQLWRRRSHDRHRVLGRISWGQPDYVAGCPDPRRAAPSLLHDLSSSRPESRIHTQHTTGRATPRVIGHVAVLRRSASVQGKRVKGTWQASRIILSPRSASGPAGFVDLATLAVT